MSVTYLTTDQLADRIHYDSRTIRNCLKDSVLLEGTHYIRPFGGRKLLFLWEAIERDIGVYSTGGSDLVGTAFAHEIDAASLSAAHIPPTPPSPGHPLKGARDMSTIPMAMGGVCHV